MKTVALMVAEAKAAIEEIPVAGAAGLTDDPDVQLVDIRDIRELWREGAVPGAYHAPRGMLEFWIDPESPYAKAVFQTPRKYVFFCAGGLRSALAAKVAQEMGLRVAHVTDGFAGWKAAGLPVVQKERKG